jgi:hypothetical protein
MGPVQPVGDCAHVTDGSTQSDVVDYSFANTIYLISLQVVLCQQLPAIAGHWRNLVRRGMQETKHPGPALQQELSSSDQRRIR